MGRVDHSLPRHCATAVLLLLTLCVYACAKSVPHLAPLPSDAVILAFGDSLTAGTGADSSVTYPAVLAGLSGRRVINAGVPGEITAEGLARLPALLDSEQPELLILCHGGNDLLRHLDAAHTRANLRAMIAAARDRGVAVVLIGVPEPRLFNRHSAPVYANLAKEFNIPLESDSLTRIEADTSLKSDGVHPNAQGYRQMAQAVYALLQRAGAL